MTEEQWNACADPQPMLEFLRDKASERKLRLFAVACSRSIWDLLTDKRSRAAVDVLEQYADGGVADAVFDAAAQDAHQAGEDNDDGENPYAAWTAANSAGSGQVREDDEDENEDSASDPLVAAQDTSFCAAQTVGQHFHPNDSGDAWYARTKAHEAAESGLLRCIFNPFRPVTIDHDNATVAYLAQAIYDERAFDRMPILADALEEAGCTNQDIIEHCRGPGPHVRGCWVVDLLLGKE